MRKNRQTGRLRSELYDFQGSLIRVELRIDFAFPLENKDLDRNSFSVKIFCKAGKRGCVDEGSSVGISGISTRFRQMTNMAKKK